MKVILSRKGFDSTTGGYSSPILPDGRLVSLPIPYANNSTKYSDLKLNYQGEGKCYGRYYELMKDLMKSLGKDRLTGYKYKPGLKEANCHADPFLDPTVCPKWGLKPSFGQCGRANNLLRNQEVEPEDILLFFGWFKKTEYLDGDLRFIEKTPDLHVSFGYLQIGEIIPLPDSDRIKELGLERHPNIELFGGKAKNEYENTSIYVARDKLTFNPKLPGSGTFKFSKELILTKPGLDSLKKPFPRSQWDLHSKWNLKFEPAKKIKVNDKNGWWNETYEYFDSQKIIRTQEFVIKDNHDVENWAKDMIKNNTSKED